MNASTHIEASVSLHEYRYKEQERQFKQQHAEHAPIRGWLLDLLEGRDRGPRANDADDLASDKSSDRQTDAAEGGPQKRTMLSGGRTRSHGTMGILCHNHRRVTLTGDWSLARRLSQKVMMNAISRCNNLVPSMAQAGYRRITDVSTSACNAVLSLLMRCATSDEDPLLPPAIRPGETIFLTGGEHERKFGPGGPSLCASQISDIENTATHRARRR